MGTQLQAEWAFVTGAPLLSAAFVIVAIAVVWGVLHFLYRHRIEGLKEELERERAEVARLRGKAEDGASATAPLPAPEKREDVPANDSASVRRIRQDAHIQVDHAKAVARGALADTRSRLAIGGAVPTMESALLTAKKVYGIEIPKSSGDARVDLLSWLRFLDEVWPLLIHGHIEEGREKAAALTAKYNAQLPDS